jgi:hypothetical protein
MTGKLPGYRIKMIFLTENTIVEEIFIYVTVFGNVTVNLFCKLVLL